MSTSTPLAMPTSALDQPATLHPDWLVPDWPAPGHVRAVFTTRSGGTSPPPWCSMNLGDHVGDDPARVRANRQQLEAATGVPTVYLQQVHGTDVVSLAASTPQGLAADACITAQRHLACTIMVADCLPVLLTTADGAVVGAAHAGWRGLAGVPPASASDAPNGVLESVFKQFKALAQSKQGSYAMNSIASTGLAAGAMAWLGPCIGPAAFEVGAEVRQAFTAADSGAASFFTPGAANKYFCDLAGLARWRLRRLGIERVYGNDSSAAWCTVSQPARYFSHRRDTRVDSALDAATSPAPNPASSRAGLRTTGRMAASIWLS